MSDGLRSMFRKAAIAAALAIGLVASQAEAATLYISEFANAVGQVGSTVAQVQPQTAITDQAIGLSGSSATSAAFNAKTHAVMLMCDIGCSINFSGAATTSNYLLQQGVPYRFVTVPAGTVSAIANAAGNGVAITQAGNTAAVSLDGSLFVNPPPASQFFDAFSSSLDTTTNWTANNSTGTAVTSAGSLVVSSSTTASAWGGLSSQQSWAPQGISSQIYGVSATFANKTIANTSRVWGVFTVPGTPTTAVPATDGYVWRLDGTGSLFAEVWVGGVAASSTNVTTACPITNGVPNTYAIFYRGGLEQFYCGAVLGASVFFVDPANQTLPISAFSIAGATPPLSSASMTLGGIGLATYSPAAGAKAAGQATTINDPYGVVGISPNANGVVPIGTTATNGGLTPVVTAAAANSKILKGSAGNLYGFEVVSGASAGVAYVFNATTLPGDGAVTPVKCYILAANSTLAVSYRPLPLVMSTGITIGFGTGTSCFTLANSATAFISGDAK